MRVLFILVLAACNDVGIDRNEAGYCATAWAAHGVDDTFVCEPGCAAPTDDFGSAGALEPCTATHPRSPATMTCTRTFDDDGQRGCCIITENDRRISFWQCE